MNEIERVARASLIDELALTIDQFLTHQIERDTLACDLTPSELTELATGVAAIAAMRGEPVGWQPIETAPKDGTIIDVWREEFGRETVYWGRRPHECGEMGPHCDSDWHREKQPGWVCSTFGEYVGGDHAPFTHWMPLPTPPDSGKD